MHIPYAAPSQGCSGPGPQLLSCSLLHATAAILQPAWSLTPWGTLLMSAWSHCGPTGLPAASAWLLASSPMAASVTAGWDGRGSGLVGLRYRGGLEPDGSTHLPPGSLPQCLLLLPLLPPHPGPQTHHCISPKTLPVSVTLQGCPSSHRHVLGPMATSPFWLLGGGRAPLSLGCFTAAGCMVTLALFCVISQKQEIMLVSLSSLSAELEAGLWCPCQTDPLLLPCASLLLPSPQLSVDPTSAIPCVTADLFLLGILCGSSNSHRVLGRTLNTFNT